MAKGKCLLTLALLAAACSSSPASETSLATTTAPSKTLTSVAPTTEPASTTTASTAPKVMGDEAAEYLDQALTLMEEWSINSDSIDWANLREETFRRAGIVMTPLGTYRAIEFALEQLNDDHSVFFSPSVAKSFSDGVASFTEPEVLLREDGIGYVSIGTYLGDIGEQADSYAAVLAQRIVGTDRRACGWIVDLRDDTGGNMWPMLGGLSPLLTDGEVGSFVYPNSRVEPWKIDGDVIFWDKMPMVNRGAVTKTMLGPTAVLVGPRTGSSGEAVTVAFRGQAETTLYGQSTRGLTTSNEPLLLSDGAMLILTMSVFTDRDGNSFGIDTPVVPDVVIGSDEDVLEIAALDLLETSACSAR